MDNKKLIGAAVTFLALLGIAIYVVWERDKSNEEVVAETPELPAIEQDAITALVITRPAEEEGAEPVPIRMEKQGDAWRVVSPVDAEADQSAIDTALEKLAELEVTGLAAENASSHETLQVDAGNGIKVEVFAGSDSVAALWVGAFRSRSTMVRVDGQDQVVTVRGSIRYAFNKELKDWRNRRVLDEDPADVVAVRFQSDNGVFDFARNASEEWEQREPEGVELAEPYAPIERFGPTKVQSVVASVARLRAVNFAAEGVDASAAGFDTPSGVVTLTIEERPEEESADEEGDSEGDSEGEEAEEGEEADEATPAAAGERRTIVLEVGAQVGEEREFYLRRRGGETLYVVSQYIADRVRPNPEDLQAPEPGSEEAATPMMPPGMPGLGGLGGPGGPSGPGGGIPPELMQKIQQQLQQQQQQQGGS